MTRAAARLALACVALGAGTLAGCGGRGPEAVRPNFTPFVSTPWDRPVDPPAADDVDLTWTEGEVIDVSMDGGTIRVKFTRGVFQRGDPIGIYVRVPAEPGPHYLYDESREMHVVDGTVVDVTADTCTAEARPATTKAPVDVGDSVVLRVY